MKTLFDFYEDTEGAPLRDLPVDRWNPPFCGDIDMRIGRDGVWYYNGGAIERPAMVRLFARILRREDDRYVLVTPVEKVGIRVEDAPFVAVAMSLDDTILSFRTNVGDTVMAGKAHGLRFVTGTDGGICPYIEVRRGLEARLTPAVARDLLALADVRDGWFGIQSGDVFFAIAPDGLTDD